MYQVRKSKYTYDIFFLLTLGTDVMPDAFNYDLHTFRSPKFRGVVKDAVEFFSNTPVYDLSPTIPFIGAGVYALYYRGDFEHYLPITTINAQDFVLPIYVGKAVPTGWRTARIKHSTGQALYGRLSEHRRSIEGVSNLRNEDFACRLMILQDIEGDLVVPVEAELIRKYKPLWNSVVDGFGNHPPGSGRYDQSASEWDILHPGRQWAAQLRGTAPELAHIIARIRNHLYEGCA